MSPVAGLRVDGWADGASVPLTRAPAMPGAVAGVLAVSPFFFSLVLALQLPQQRPRENHGQHESHEKGKNDINRDHEN